MVVSFGGWLRAFRRIDSLLDLEAKYGRLFETQSKRLDEMADRLNRLEAREQVLIAEAKGAASAAASSVSASHIGELARLVGGLEERVRRLEGGDHRVPRLSPPER